MTQRRWFRKKRLPKELEVIVSE
jgi:hypothetical protein